MTEEDTARFLKAVAVATGDPERTDRIGAVHDTAQALTRGAATVTTVTIVTRGGNRMQSG